MTIQPKQPFPLIPKDLAERLNEQFPERCPSLTWTDREVWLEVGKREAIKFIINKYNEQVKASLK